MDSILADWMLVVTIRRFPFLPFKKRLALTHHTTWGEAEALAEDMIAMRGVTQVEIWRSNS